MGAKVGLACLYYHGLFGRLNYATFRGRSSGAPGTCDPLHSCMNFDAKLSDIFHYRELLSNCADLSLNMELCQFVV